MYAIAIDRNRQVLCRPGQDLLLDYNAQWKPGTEVVLDQVCVLGGDDPKIGAPYIDGAKVILEVRTNDVKGPKLFIGKFKRRKGYRRRTGFRARFSRVVVRDIQGPGERDGT